MLSVRVWWWWWFGMQGWPGPRHFITLNARNKHPDHSTLVKEGESLILSVLMSPLKHEDISFEDLDSSVSVVS